MACAMTLGDMPSGQGPGVDRRYGQSLGSLWAVLHRLALTSLLALCAAARGQIRVVTNCVSAKERFFTCEAKV